MTFSPFVKPMERVAAVTTLAYGPGAGLPCEPVKSTSYAP
jgi:hypothetical protein